MSPLQYSITSCSLLFALLAFGTSARAQVYVGSGQPPISTGVQPGALEDVIHLELYGHPDTSRRHLQVRVQQDRVLLTGSVANDIERRTARRISAEVTSDLRVDDRLELTNDDRSPRLESAGDLSPADLEHRFIDVLAGTFPAEILNELSLTVYRVDLPMLDPSAAPSSKQRVRFAPGWVLVLEGLVPTVRDQLAMSELLLFEYPVAAAVINRTYVSDGYVPGYRPKSRVRAPLVDVDVDDDNGVEVRIGPLVVRTGQRQLAEVVPNLLDEYLAAVRADAYLRNAPVHPHLVADVLTIDGTLEVADRMRAVSLAGGLSGLRGVVDRMEVIEGKSDFYNLADLRAFVVHLLGEHAGARNVEIVPIANNRLELRGVVSSEFNAAVARAVIASDLALSRLPIRSEFRDADSGALLTSRN